MKAKHIHKKVARTAEEISEIQNIRNYYQSKKPSLEEIESDFGESVTLGEFIVLSRIAISLKQERERQNMTLATLEEITGIDQAALSRLENGKNVNPTLGTIVRISQALGKRIDCVLHDIV